MQSPTFALRLALRGLRRSRAVTLIAMLTLGSGLTAAVALLGVTDAGVRSLPVPDGGSIVALVVRNARAERVEPPAPVADWAVGRGILEAGALRQFTGTLARPGHAARRAAGAAMHASVLRLLRVPPALGRLPDEADDTTVLVLGWRTFEELGGDASMIGARIDVDDVPHTVIGVMPPGFGFPESEAFWTVLPGSASGEIVARLAPGTDRRTAAAAVAARLDARDAALGGDGAPHRVSAERWTMSRDGGRDETVVFAALSTLVLLLLLVCCANVATLLLVRGTERAGVLAVQHALGASRRQVTGQLFLESAIIAAGGGIIGLAGGALLLRWMELRLAAHWGYYWMAMEVRPPVLLAALGLIVLCALLAGTMPALRAGRVDLALLLAGQGRGGTDRRRRRLGRWLVGTQAALSSVGLIAAVFLAGEFRDLGRVTTRLPLDRVAVVRLTLPAAAVPHDAARADAAQRLRDALGRLPGVTDVSIASGAPGGPSRVATLHLRGADPADVLPRVMWVAADSDLLRVYDMRVVAGRSLHDRDRANAVLVTTGVADRHFGGDAVGRSLRLDGVHDDDTWAEIVGVVEDWLPDQRGAPADRVIVPLAAAWPPSPHLALATAGDARTVLGHVRGAVQQVDERIAVEELRTLRERMDWFLRMMKVIAGFGALGGFGSALVAAVGLYGVMSYQVRIRRRELGIRMAVGAAAHRIAFEVARESVLRVVPGLVTGAVLALGTVPLIVAATGMTPPDGAVTRLAGICAMAGTVLLAIGVLAGLEPALRAARLDPLRVLRTD